MIKFYDDKEQIFECKINIQGDSYKKITPRLVLTDSNSKNIFFEGKVEAGKCIIKVPAISEMSGKGKAQLELVIDSGLFTPWKSEFEIKSSMTKIKVQEIQVKTENIKIEKIEEEFQPEEFQPEEVKEEIKKEVQPKVIKEVKKVNDYKAKVRDDFIAKKQKVKKRKKIREQIVKKSTKLFKENIIKDNKILIIELLNVFRKLDGVSKISLIRQANSHKPSKKVINWTNQIFCNPNSQYAKICIFEIDKFLKNKPNTKSFSDVVKEKTLVENLKKETKVFEINYQQMMS